MFVSTGGLRNDPKLLAPQFYIYVILCVYIYIYLLFYHYLLLARATVFGFNVSMISPMLTDIVGGTLEVNHHSAKHTIMCMYIYMYSCIHVIEYTLYIYI